MGMLNLSLFQNAAIFCRTKWAEIGKKRVRRVVFLVGILSVMATISGCCTDCYPHGDADPVYLSYEELRKPIKLAPPNSIIKSGKIWVSGKYLLVNDLNRGIHVFDNTDPKSPQNLGLILIPGNVDLATNTKGSVLFADSFIDFIAIDLERLPDIAVLKRMENIFPYNPYQMIDHFNIYLTGLDQSKGVVIGYTLREKKKRRDILLPFFLEKGQTEGEDHTVAP